MNKQIRNYIIVFSVVIVAFILCMLCMHYQCKSIEQKYQTEVEETARLNKAINAISTELNGVQHELDKANATIADLSNEEYKFVYLGNFKITHYCTEQFEHICGTGDNRTATGAIVTPGTTIAVDPSAIPYGTKVYINGYGFRSAQDCGGAVKGRHIDVAVSTHDEAMKLGTIYKDIWILVKKS